MFKFFKQLGSILILCTLLLSINSYVYADDYDDCILNNTKIAEQTCTSFEKEVLDECSKTKKLDGTTYDTVIKCQEALQKKIDQCIEKLKNESKSTCDSLKATTNSEDANTTAPSIPNIKTVVRPNVSNVSQVSPYLSTTFLPRVANTIVSFGIGAAVLGLILGSIGLLTAYGNDEKYGNAKKSIYFSLIGLVICLLAFAIVQIIFYTGFQAGQIK